MSAIPVPPASPGSPRGVQGLPTLPASVRGAPPGLRRQIRKRQNSESARRCRERKKLDVLRAAAERDQHAQQLALLERAVRVLAARLHAVSAALARVGVPLDVAAALAAAGVAGCANGTPGCAGGQCPACVNGMSQMPCAPPAMSHTTMPASMEPMDQTTSLGAPLEPPTAMDAPGPHDPAALHAAQLHCVLDGPPASWE